MHAKLSNEVYYLLILMWFNSFIASLNECIVAMKTVVLHNLEEIEIEKKYLSILDFPETVPNFSPKCSTNTSI